MKKSKRETIIDNNIDLTDSFIKHKIVVNDNNAFYHNYQENILNSQKLWGGYYTGDIKKLSAKITSSFSFDWRFYANVIKILKAHIRMCVKRSIISESDGTKIRNALDKIKRDIDSGKISLNIGEYKNIDECIRTLLYNEIGEVAYNSNIANSFIENQITLTKIWMRDALDNIDLTIQSLEGAILDKAEAHVKTIFPSYAFGGTAQPISLAYHMMSYFEILNRDRGRIANARSRLNISPMGVVNGVGTSFEINRRMVAKELDFQGIAINGLDAVCNLDFMMEFITVMSICANNISKIGQDLLKFQSYGIELITFSDNLLNNVEKFNINARYPEIIEYAIAQSSSVLGHLNSVMITLNKSQTSVSQNLGEISESAFKSYKALVNVLNLLALLIADFSVNRKGGKELAQSSSNFYTDIFDWLIQNIKCSYQEASQIANNIISKSINDNIKLSLIELKDLQKIDSRITKDIYSVLITTRSIISRRSDGGSNNVRIRKHIRQARRTLY